MSCRGLEPRRFYGDPATLAGDSIHKLCEGELLGTQVVALTHHVWVLYRKIYGDFLTIFLKDLTWSGTILDLSP